MDAKQLGSFLVMLRKEKNMTQKQLADKIHVTDKAISKWECVDWRFLQRLDLYGMHWTLRLPNSFSVSGRRRLL